MSGAVLSIRVAEPLQREQCFLGRFGNEVDFSGCRTCPTQNNKQSYKQTKPNPNQARPKPNRTKPHQTKPNQTKPNQTKPEPNQTIKRTGGRRHNSHQIFRGGLSRVKQLDRMAPFPCGHHHPVEHSLHRRGGVNALYHTSDRSPTSTTVHDLSISGQTDS